MAKPLVRMRIDGLDDLVEGIRTIKGNVNPVLRQAARKSSTPIVQEVRQNLPARGKRTLANGRRVFTYGLTGQLRKSIASKILTSRAGVVHAVIGPRRGFKTSAFKAYHKPNRTAEAQRNVMVPVNPTMYAHLVESGFTAKLWRSGKTKAIPGKGIMRKALEHNRGRVETITRQVLDESLARAVDRKFAAGALS